MLPDCNRMQNENTQTPINPKGCRQQGSVFSPIGLWDNKRAEMLELWSTVRPMECALAGGKHVVGQKKRH